MYETISCLYIFSNTKRYVVNANRLNHPWCRHLEEFYISGQDGQATGLTGFPTVLGSLEHLTALSFTHQHLGRLPLEVSQLAKLAYLSIE